MSSWYLYVLKFFYWCLRILNWLFLICDVVTKLIKQISLWSVDACTKYIREAKSIWEVVTSLLDWMKVENSTWNSKKCLRLSLKPVVCTKTVSNAFQPDLVKKKMQHILNFKLYIKTIFKWRRFCDKVVVCNIIVCTCFQDPVISRVGVLSASSSSDSSSEDDDDDDSSDSDSDSSPATNTTTQRLTNGMSAITFTWM